MGRKRTIKICIDVFSLTALPILMAEIHTGQELHEWVGVGMILLFILHHAMNFGWIRTLAKGDYTPYRAVNTGLALLLLMDFVGIVVSGTMMSGYVFVRLPIHGGMITARTLHLFATHWGFILMSLHTGMHIRQITAAFQKKKKTDGEDSALKWFFRGLFAGLVLLGAYSFLDQKITDYLFMQTHFVFFDEEKSVFLFFFENIAVIAMFAVMGHLLCGCLRKAGCGDMGKKVAKVLAFLIPVLICVGVIFALRGNGGNTANWAETPSELVGTSPGEQPSAGTDTGNGGAEPGIVPSDIQDGFLLIPGGSFVMGSPETENWRSADETQHIVSVSSFYMSPYEVTQEEYESLMGENPSMFSGEKLPVESVSWLDAVRFCNARSDTAGLTPAYAIDGNSVSWDRTADGYRLPTESEWEYACRAGTDTPFNTETSIGADEANYYGHYPYEIEENYFSQENLETKPGEYRQTTVAVDSFSPNAWGLYNMHGNVSEWVWDYYGSYAAEEQVDPAGPENGALRVYRGGGWNDFAKNMRSAYRATLSQDKSSLNLGIRLVRGAFPEGGTISTGVDGRVSGSGEKILIAYFSWGGNTRGIAQEVAAQTGAEVFEIQPVNQYSSDYNTVLMEAQHDQNIQARPELDAHVENMDDYGIILLGYPNWWASIPMPIASFLEEYDFSGKTIIPFCSNGGGRFGQSLTAISKLAPDANIGEGLSVHYSGGSELPADVSEWLETNGIK